jgi:hypothetical protein
MKERQIDEHLDVIDLGEYECLNDTDLNLEDEIEIYEREGFQYNKYDLRYYFNLIKFDEVLHKVKKYEYQSLKSFKLKDEENDSQLDFEGLFADAIHAKYFEDDKILVIENYPIYEIYKLESIFEECKFLGSEYMDINICEFIDRFLNGGKG